MEDFERLKAQKDAYMKADRPCHDSCDATQAAARFERCVDLLSDYTHSPAEQEALKRAIRLNFKQALAQARADGLREAKQEVIRLRDNEHKGRTVLFPGAMDLLRNPDDRIILAKKCYNIACDDVVAILEQIEARATS